ncbi:SusC/RagA family TonB-linked outer membrane protein [Chitinophaga solisilvae]|uniref:SusC/RagA family TonB-linked outer membrane protein n=1 Tax=Chitinophaga solisilvae TaxID=1233460 RepID=UPI0013717C68|nr:SusC/RagA family TonB-linked outer membrane protein [Chitinophaga solisilvae]
MQMRANRQPMPLCRLSSTRIRLLPWRIAGVEMPPGYRKKLLRCMKLITFFLLGILLQVSASTYSQTVTMDKRNVSVKAVFREIYAQTGYEFFYVNEILKHARKVSISGQHLPLKAVLDQCSKDQPFTYSILDKTIVLQSKTTNAAPEAAVPPAAPAPPRIWVTGRILDESGNPLPGVVVVIKNTTTGNVSGAEGNFRIEVEPGATLVFSYLGYETKEVVVKDDKALFLTLVRAVTAIRETVVTGIFTRKKESFTGAVASFTGKELKAIGNQNVIQSLKALDPSFVVLDNNLKGANPNTMPNIELRGKTSVAGGTIKDQFSADPNLPLFILNGFETTLQKIIDLDMNRVASVTILKDAASTAMYGAKAANGVVVVETKLPAAGKLQLSYTGDFRLEVPDLRSYNLMDAAEKLEFERLSGRYKSKYGARDQMEMDMLYNKRLQEVNRGVNTYWMNEPVQKGFANGHSLYAEGGDDQMRYGAGVNYKKISGVMKGSGRSTWGANIDLNYRRGKVNIINQLYLSGYEANESPYGSFADFAAANPFFRKYNSEGKPDRYLDTIDGYKDVPTLVPNPLYNGLLSNINKTKNNDIQNNLQLLIDLPAGFRVQGGLQLSKSQTTGEVFTPAGNTLFDKVSIYEKGRYVNTRTEKMGYNANLMLIYGRVYGQHSITGNLRGDIEHSRSWSYATTAVGFPESVTNGNPAYSYGYEPDKRPATATAVFRRANVLGSVNYAWAQKYLLDLTARLDGSTAFGNNQKYTPFWSVGVGWNLEKESFMQHIGWIDRLKLRGSIGTSGNQNFGATTSASVYTYATGVNPFGQGILLQSLGNPDLRWQKTNTINLGMDAELMHHRLSASFNVYQRNTDPLVIQVSKAASTGLQSYSMNAGWLKTKGAEVNLRFSPVYMPARQIVWTVGLTGAMLKSEYGNISRSLQALNKLQLDSSRLARYNDGYSPTDLWAVRSAGIDPQTGQEIFIDRNGHYTFLYSPEDIVRIGNSQPLAEGVISTYLNYKGLLFSASIRYRYGGMMFNEALFNKVENISLDEAGYNQDRRALYSRWKKPGDVAMFKSIGLTRTEGKMSDRFIQRDDQLLGESFSLGYDFQHRRWLRRMGMQSLRLNAYMNDLFRLSTIRAERGIDYPYSNSVSFSINALF